MKSLRSLLGVVALAFALFAAPALRAQDTAAPAPAATPNFYGAGLSWNPNGSPQFAGTALYERDVTSVTKAFTLIDVVPSSVKPFTVTSNVAVGIAQQVATFASYKVYIPTSAGISWTGPNTGWAWGTGAAVAIPLKDGWTVVPTVRVLKSSVSGGTGYQPIVGFVVGKNF